MRADSLRGQGRARAVVIVLLNVGAQAVEGFFRNLSWQGTEGLADGGDIQGFDGVRRISVAVDPSRSWPMLRLS